MSCGADRLIPLEVRLEANHVQRPSSRDAGGIPGNQHDAGHSGTGVSICSGATGGVSSDPPGIRTATECHAGASRYEKLLPVREFKIPVGAPPDLKIDTAGKCQKPNYITENVKVFTHSFLSPLLSSEPLEGHGIYALNE